MMCKILLGANLSFFGLRVFGQFFHLMIPFERSLSKFIINWTIRTVFKEPTLVVYGIHTRSLKICCPDFVRPLQSLPLSTRRGSILAL